MSIKVDAGDVIRLMMQFCRENSLNKTLAALQEETHITMNTVESVDSLVLDVTNGRWDAVLQQIATLSLPLPLLFDIYEQMVIELIELKEIDTARAILGQTEAMIALKERDQDRYLRLQRLLAKPYFSSRDAYPDGSSKEKRRGAIAKALAAEVRVVAPSRLMALLSQSIKWQQHQGLLPPGTELDLFRGTAAEQVEEEEALPKSCDKTITLGKKSHPESACFSPDGQYLVTGSVDGFIEVWDWITGKLRTDLTYQAEDRFMMHDDSVFCCKFSKDSELLVSGSQDGKIKVWRISTGKCLRRFERAHSEGITSVCFADDKSHILSASFDQTVRVHGLKSGKTLKIFRGHTSYVNAAIYVEGGRRIASASSDGTIRLWDAKSTDCLLAFSPATTTGNVNASIHSIHISPLNEDHLIVGNKTSNVYIMNMEGKTLKTFSLDKGIGDTTSFVQCIPSRRGGWIYALADNSVLYCFNMTTSYKLEHTLKLHDSEVIGLAHHPHRNFLASYADDGTVQIWKAS